MGVYIKGMEMPVGCPFCPLSHWTRATDEFAGCNIVPGKRFAMLNDIAFAESPAKSRPDYCPLVPVPPHGRLIDADALLSLLDKCMFPSDMVTTSAVRMATNWIKDAPTVIEAEGGE